MRHFSCDLCGTDLTPAPDARYVVKVATHPAAAPAGLTEADLDGDPIDDMAELLDELEAGGQPAPDLTAARSLEYDLCPGCYRRFLADPLGRERGRKMQFSKN
jgi:hypothetical protein